MIDERKLDARNQNRAKICSDIWTNVEKECFAHNLPADICLKKTFKQNHGMGGRDRRFYSAMVFEVLRWLGPLQKKFAGKDQRNSFYLAGAAAETDCQDPASDFFFRDIHVDRKQINGVSPMDRMNSFLSLCNESAIQWQDLYPEFFFDHLDFIPDQTFFQLEQQRPPLWMRCFPEKTDQIIHSLAKEGISAEAYSSIPGIFSIDNPRINLLTTETGKKFPMAVQDLSSQCIGLYAAAEPGEIWWDVCAGGGGKTLQLASLMQGKGKILASDIREEKLMEIKHRAERMGFRNMITAEVRDGRSVRNHEQFDGVLVDAPCSSSGRWRRNPEGRWMITEEKIRYYANLQQEILQSAAQSVRPGGTLIYATCSLFKDENRLNVESFIQNNPDFSLEPFVHPLTGEMTPGYMQILPQIKNHDASFVARFNRLSK